MEQPAVDTMFSFEYCLMKWKKKHNFRYVRNSESKLYISSEENMIIRKITPPLPIFSGLGESGYFNFLLCVSLFVHIS